MTIRHLLSHTSGIGYGFTQPDRERADGEDEEGRVGAAAARRPGHKWNYRASTRVLGMIVEKMTGAPLEAWYQEHIFKPLGMVDTSYAVAAGQAVARGAAVHSRVTGTMRRTAAGDHPVDADGAVPRRRRPLLHGRGLRASSCGCCSTAGTLGGAKILSRASVKMMGQNAIGSIFVELQPDADKQRTKPFPLGAGKDKFGLGFPDRAERPATQRFRSPGSMSWAGIFNTEFWVDPVKHIGGVQMMQVLPFYDDGAIRTLRGFEEMVYKNLP